MVLFPTPAGKNRHFLRFFNKLTKIVLKFQKSRRKVKSLKIGQKIQLKKVTIRIFFQFLGEFFSSPQIPRHRKMQCYFKNISTRTCCSVIPRLTEYREAQLVLNFLYVATHLSPRMQGSIFSFRLP